MRVSDFDFDLPDSLIAQDPPPGREASRLMVVDRARRLTSRAWFRDLPELLEPGDVLVVNDTRVFPARLRGHRVPSGGAVECLLLGRRDALHWDALVHPGQKLRPGARMRFGEGADLLEGEIVSRHHFGRRVVALHAAGHRDVDEVVDAIGEVPLPPYIKRPVTSGDRDRYQTVYATERGSIAAPTAGLHFTAGLLERLVARGIERASITLHVGYGTFKPVRVDRVDEHRVDPEHYVIAEPAAETINRALREGRRVVAVGTTTTRALEAASQAGGGPVVAGRAVTDLFIYPGFPFRVVGALVTNFHLPRSSLLMLVSAFAGRELLLEAYRQAVAEGFRFYSYGDAMLVR